MPRLLSLGVTGGQAVDSEAQFEQSQEGAITSMIFLSGVETTDSDDWQRITEDQLSASMDAYRVEAEEGVAPLPGAFDPSALPGGDPEQPATCLH